MVWILKRYSERFMTKINLFLIKGGRQPLNKKECEKLININYKIWFWIWAIAKTIFFIVIFTKISFDRLGFERTAILLLTLIFIRLWFNSVQNKPK